MLASLAGGPDDRFVQVSLSCLLCPAHLDNREENGSVEQSENNISKSC